MYYGNPSGSYASNGDSNFVSGEVEALTTKTRTTWGSGSSNPEDTYNTYYHDSRNEIIYTFTDFYDGNTTYYVPIKVTDIKLERYQAPGDGLENYRIKYQLTTASSVGTSFTTAGWTLIWGPVTHTPVAGWNNYNVSDFYWTKDNLRLDLTLDKDNYVSGGGMYRRTGLSAAKMCTYYSDSGRTWPFDGTCTQRDYAPVVKFVGLLRKYASPEPTAIMGNETAAGISKAGSYGIGANTTTAFASINNQTISGVISSGWNSIALTYDKNAESNQQKLFVNGELKTQGTLIDAISTNSNNLLVGDFFNSLIDEVRISNTARSAAWIKASYNSENNSLLTYGSEETGL